MKILFPLAVILLFSSLLPAEDVAGAQDPLGLKRYDGTRATFYKEEAFASYPLPLGKMKKTRTEVSFENSIILEGKVTSVTYIGSDPTRTALEVFRNYQTELLAKGWEILWEGTEAELSDAKGQLFLSLYANRPSNTFQISALGCRYLAAKKDGTHLSLFVTNFNAGTVTPKTLQPAKGVPIIALDVIESAAMEKKMVVVKAEEMASHLTELGGINMYGFHFDTGSAELKPESGPALAEMEKLLKADAALHLLIVGHTDGVGGFEENIALSRQRAASVVAAIAQRMPEATSRLTACGVGFQCPIATNLNEEGRAKNRRVALVCSEK